MIFMNSLKTKRTYFIITMLFIVFIYVFVAQKIGGNREERFFARFDTTNINGILRI